MKLYLQSVHPRRQNRFGRSFLVVFKELTRRYVRILNGECPDPTGSELPASGVDGIAILSGNNRWIDAQILAGGEAKGEDSCGGAEVAELVLVEETELG